MIPWPHLLRAAGGGASASGPARPGWNSNAPRLQPWVVESAWEPPPPVTSKTMSDHHVMTYCLLLGLGLGVLAGANLMIATAGDLRGGLPA